MVIIMSADLETMMYNSKNGLPWHREGTPIEGLATSAQAIEASGLDWEVNVEPVYLANGDEVEDSKAIVRQTDKKVFNVLGNRYTPLQNKEAFEFFDGIVGEDEAIYETAGSLKGGKIVWLLAKMPDFIRIGNTDDVIKKYVLLANSHDGSSPVTVMTTPIRVVCNNTLSFALKGHEERIKVRHTKNMVANLEQGRYALGIVNKVYSQLNDIFNAMDSVDINGEFMDEYLNNVLNGGKEEVATRTENVILDVKKVYAEGAGVDDPAILKGRDNLWRLYNSLTEYVDHYKNYRSDTDVLHAISMGSGATIKERAFKEAVRMLN